MVKNHGEYDAATVERFKKRHAALSLSLAEIISNAICVGRVTKLGILFINTWRHTEQEMI